MNAFFFFGNVAVMPFWLLMILAPGWSWTHRIVRSPLIFLTPALVYAVLVIPDLPTLLPIVARPELGEVAALLGTPRGTVIAWMHFLAFDLLIGRWIYLDAKERGWRFYVTAPTLFLTLMFGPMGLLVYLAVATAGRRRTRRNTQMAPKSMPSISAYGRK